MATTQTIHDLISWAEPRLENVGVDSKEARLGLAYALKRTESWVMVNESYKVPPTKQKIFREYLRRRSRGMPYAYITGSKQFYGLDFFVSSDVLIPRPETEDCVDRILKVVDRRKSLTIADIGTGSGCIAVTLAKYLPAARILATDLSLKALAVAKRNARKHGVSKRLRFFKGDLLQALPTSQRPDLIVANLPYLEKHELANVPHEPVNALYGGRQGLEYIDKCVDQVIERGIAWALFEIAPKQEAWLEMRLSHERAFSTTFIADLSGRIRFLELKRKEDGAALGRTVS